jgi:hypothetical protein
MLLKSSKRNVKSGNAHRSDERDARTETELKRLSSALEEYGAAAEEGAVEKVSKLAEEIVEIIARSRRQISSSGYYHRRIE